MDFFGSRPGRDGCFWLLVLLLLLVLVCLFKAAALTIPAVKYIKHIFS